MQKELKPLYTKGNEDNLGNAIQGLDQFTKNWCMDCKQTEEKNEPVFRCDRCIFQKKNGICEIKEFVIDNYGDIPTDFGSMGR